MDADAFGDCWMYRKFLDIPNPKVYKKLGMKVLSKNPHLNTFYKMSCTAMLTTKLCPLQQMSILILEHAELENVDLGNSPNLRCLIMKYYYKLKVVNGWEGVKGIGWLEICYNPSYCDLPNVQFLSFLKEFRFEKWRGQSIPWQLANFSICVQLRRLDIHNDNELVESMDLEALRFLEVLSFARCGALSTIHRLSGLHTLMEINVSFCKNLKMVLDLGCLKALTHLDMSWSGIVEIPSVEELHLLILLNLGGCLSLESLPPLGHLKALAYLNLSVSSIEEIHGVEDLMSLETLHCYGSKLKQLPNLDHLRRLWKVDIDDTPLSGINPWGYELIHNERKKEEIFVDDISDISDTNDFEDTSSDED